jgi:trimeric autotransporter adhesin
MKKNSICLYCFCIWIGSAISLKAQIGINADNSLPHASAMLEIKSNNKGILFPRMTFAERNLIKQPAIGLIIYQTNDLQGLYHYTSTGWKNLNSSSVVSYFQLVSENNNDGYRLYGRDTVQHGNIGSDAIDLSSTIAGGPTNNYGATGNYSFAVGLHVKAIGDHSLAMGLQNIASGLASVSLGLASVATGNMSFAMGNKANATKLHSFAFGDKTNATQLNAIAIGANTTASGANAVAIGFTNQSLGTASVALGANTKAIGNYATAFGNLTTASGLYSTAIGFNNTASGDVSTAMGFKSIAAGIGAIAAGDNAIAKGQTSTAFGTGTTAKSFSEIVVGSLNTDYTAAGVTTFNAVDRAFTVGIGSNINNKKDGLVVYKDGTLKLSPLIILPNDTVNRLYVYKNRLTYNGERLETSQLEKININDKIGHRLFGKNSANYGIIGNNAVDLSQSDIVSSNGATGVSAIATGLNTKASGDYSTALGTLTTASGASATAIGNQTTASGVSAISMGYQTSALGVSTTASGYKSIASGAVATAIGFNTIAVGDAAVALGNETIAKSYSEVVVGSFNTDYTPIGVTTYNIADRAFGVGIGSNNTDKKDGLIVYKDGTIGLTPFSAPPTMTNNRLYAVNNQLMYNGAMIGEASQLQRLAQNGNTGYRLLNSNAANYGAIGNKAVDLSESANASTTKGATGNYAVAFGNETTASKNAATAIGQGTTASGDYAVAMGLNTIASGSSSLAMGDGGVTASAHASISLGWHTTALGNASVAMCDGTVASGQGSAALGTATIARSHGEVAVGDYNSDYTPNSTTQFNINDRAFIVGIGSDNSNRKDGLVVYKDGTLGLTSLLAAPSVTNNRLYSLNNKLMYNGAMIGEASQLQLLTQNGKIGYRFLGANAANYGNIGNSALDLSTSSGASTTRGATGDNSVAFGTDVIASAWVSVATGYQTQASNIADFAAGYQTQASGSASTAFGFLSKATGANSVSLGHAGTASGNAATTLGSSSLASGNFSIAAGYNSKAIGGSSFALGTVVEATANDGFATGNSTKSTAMRAAAFGFSTIASGENSMAIGHGSTAKSYSETVVGSYNTNYTPISASTYNVNDRAFVVGIGMDANNTKDGFVLLKNGAAIFGNGTSTPKGKVYIENGFNADMPLTYTYLAQHDPPVSSYEGVQNLSVSLYADNRILSSEFNAFSDKRIKDVIGQSNIKADLNLLAKISITDYTMKDKIQYGNKAYKKVIAQELKTIYPQAVSLSTNFIPNIYKAAAVKDNWVDLKADVIKGDKIKIIATAGIQEVIVEAVEANRFKINLPNAERIFFYGKEVNDFHTVDYEALTTLNISATQALLDEVQQLKTQNVALKSQVESLNQLKAEVQQIKAMIQADKVSVIKQ